jgi:eukaryotic-like serine/threonine-protein kinase
MEEPRRLGGRYELGSVLGRGGMAEVHLAHDTRLGRTVAVKTLRVDLARDPTFQARFRREAQSAASLNHPAIVAVYDTGEDYVDGVSIPYIVMEYVDGSTLRELLHSGRKLLPERSMEMCIGILQALEYSHRNGIVHRDIKPANVMLTRTGQVKVMDFGIARAMGDSGMTMTQTAAVIGTAQYLSPEQAKGESVDARSDLYSTGCLLYELLTVRPPFVGDSPVAVAYQHVREEAQPPSVFDPEISPAMDAIVMRALVKDPDYRYQSADEMRADIEACLDGQPVAATAAMGVAAAGGGYGYPHDDRPTTALRTHDAQQTTMMPPTHGGDDGYYDDEPRGRRRPPKKSNTSTILLVIAAILVLIGAIFMGNAIWGSNGDRGTISVPGLAGQSYDDAKSAGQNGDFKVTKGQTEYCKQKKGTICKTDPKAGTKIQHGDTVTVIMSKGPAPKDVPDVTNQKYDQARQTLIQAGFKVKKKTQQSSDADPGTVLSQDPNGDAKAKAGSTVTLTVATKTTKQVPNVVGNPFDQAKAQLEKLGFQVAQKTKEDGSKPAGTVLEQDKTGEQPVGTTIVLTTATPPPQQNVAVPNVTNQLVKDAIKALKQQGLKPQLAAPMDPNNSTVVSTNPPAGTQVPQGSTVTITPRPGPPSGGDQGGGFFGGAGSGKKHG